MLRLIIFDWDGTLHDTAQRIITSMRNAAADMNMPQPHDKSVRQIIGLELAEAIRQIFPSLLPEQMDQMQKLFSQFCTASQVPMPIFPGVETTLQHLKKCGTLLAVATNKTRPGLNRHIRELGWEALFHYTRCADEAPSKPNPQMILDVCKALNVSTAEALMVGDTTYDLEMAYAIGMPSVGVLYGAHSRQQLEKFNPRALIQNFSELLAICHNDISPPEK